MSLATTNAPELNDTDHTLLFKISQSLVDASVTPSVVTTKTVQIGPDAAVPVKILDANPKRRKVIIQNRSVSTAVMIGSANVNGNGGPPQMGFPLYAQQLNNPGLGSRIEILTTGELWGASTTALLDVIEFSIP